MAEVVGGPYVELIPEPSLIFPIDPQKQLIIVGFVIILIKIFGMIDDLLS